MSLLDKPIWFEINSSVARLGESLHQLINNMLALGDVPEDLEAHIKSFSEEADRLRQSVAEHAHHDRFPQVMVSDETGKRPYYVKGGMIGDHHPFVPAATLEHKDGVTTGTVYFDVAYEGPPGCVHGGFVSFFFDQILGNHNMANNIPAMTASLTVNYLKPTPLMTELGFEVRTDSIDGRKVIDLAWLTADGERVCECEGLFLMPTAENYMGSVGSILLAGAEGEQVGED